MNPKPYGEIVESSLSSFLAHCWEWDTFPSFGDLVCITAQDITTFAVVTEITTGSLDPLRHPFPYKKTEEELLKEQPQIFEFLKTTFKAHIVGYKNTSMYYLLPPKPCKMHAFVSACPPELKKEFFSRFDFLHLLFAAHTYIPNFEELLLAIISQLAKNKMLSSARLEEFSMLFSLLTGSDYRRLKLFLYRAQELVL